MTREHHIDLTHGDIGETVLLPGDPARVKIFAELMDEVQQMAHKREYVTYTGVKDGVRISCTSTGIGCPGTSIVVEELYNIGAKNLIRIGTGGAWQPQIGAGDMIIATASVRGDGTSVEYVPLEYPAIADYRVVRALIDSCKEMSLRYHVGIIRSHDAFYMECGHRSHGDWLARIRPWTDAGVLGVENEASALFVVSSLRRLRAGCIITTGGYQPSGESEDLTPHIRNMVKVGILAAQKLAKGGDK